MSRDARAPTRFELHRGHDPPPAGFDPLAASDRDLLRYGLPRRPDAEREPELARIWERAFSSPLTYARASLAIDKELRNRNPLQEKDATFGSNNWAGAVVRAGAPFSWVFAEWVVPGVPTKSIFDDTVTIGFWVGIDGVTVGDDQVLQAGVAVTMETHWLVGPFVWPHVEVRWRVWTEWWVKDLESSGPVYLTNFPVKPGDLVSFLVCAPQSESGAWVNILNSSTGQHTSVDVPTPMRDGGEPVTLEGDSVEWIVEVVEPAAPNIPAFNPITFRDCLAGTQDGIADFGNADTVNIIGDNGDLTNVRLWQPHTVIVRRA